MGLDMYLTKRIYIGGNYDHRKVTGTVKITMDDKEIDIDPKDITEIITYVGEWRKANAIHAWFVRAVQDGIDNCQEYYVSGDELTVLKTLCEKALKDTDVSILPPQSGFFFGSTETGKWYWEDLEYTVKMLTDLEPGSYYYRSSW